MKLFPGQFGEMLQQLGDLRSQADEFQKELEKKKFETSAGGGMVSIAMNGAGVIENIQFDATLLTIENKKLLEDLTKAAVNDGLRKAKDMLQEEVQRKVSSLPFGGLFSSGRT